MSEEYEDNKNVPIIMIIIIAQVPGDISPSLSVLYYFI